LDARRAGISPESNPTVIRTKTVIPTTSKENSGVPTYSLMGIMLKSAMIPYEMRKPITDPVKTIKNVSVKN
jgi:hypothetical protein